jgi:hypothetical protein
VCQCLAKTHTHESQRDDETTDDTTREKREMARNKKKGVVWDGPPPPPTLDLVEGDPSCQGTVGFCLLDALKELQNEDAEEVEQDCFMTTDKVERIMKSFGQAVAQSQTREMLPSDGSTQQAPAALLRGRVDHFNRRINKWRIVVENAEFRRHVPLDRNRRKREMHSLWNVSEEKLPLPATPPSKRCKLEILAYNDRL